VGVVGDLEFSPGFWDQLLAGPGRASAAAAPPAGNVTPDKAKGHQLDTDGLSAPCIPLGGTPGVENKYIR
jgi:hypothetical protein